jgi:hypothetical protein
MCILCDIRLPTSDDVNENLLQKESLKSIEKAVLDEIQDGKTMFNSLIFVNILTTLS